LAAKKTLIETSAVDPDPAFQVNPDPDSIRIQGFDDQKMKKKRQLKISLSVFDF
jgi:hypothetical protein